MVDLTDVHAAAQRLLGQVLHTPCVESRTLSQITGAQVFLKFENLQFTASFKERGACNALMRLTRQDVREATDVGADMSAAGPLPRREGPLGGQDVREATDVGADMSAAGPLPRREGPLGGQDVREATDVGAIPGGVIAMSAGNHAQGVAYHAQRLGLRAVIVMPSFTPGVKIERTRSFGAEIVLHGDSLDAAREHALALARQQGLHFVHPYDDADVIAGQGTVGLEMLHDVPDLDCLLISVGGGGLIAGMATAVKAIHSGIEVVGVQTSRFPAMYNAIKGQHLPQGQSSIAEGIAVGTPGKLTQAIIQRAVDDIVLVDEGDIEQSIVMLLEIEKTLVEGAGAAGLAAMLKYPERFRGKKVGLVLSGGNIDPLLLASIIERGMVRAGRLARIRVGARDVPGSLAQITATVAQAGANIEEVHHQRAFTVLAVQNVEIELVLQTRGKAHLQDVLQALRNSGFEAQAQ